MVKNNYFDIVFVSGHSMQNNFHDGDILLYSVVSDEKEINRFDTIVAKVSDTKLIKRVVGLPKDEVLIVGDIITINGIKMTDLPFHTSKKDEEVCHIILGEDEYFILGENLDESADSREFGSIKFDTIYGVVKYQIYPFSDFGSVNYYTG